MIELYYWPGIPGRGEFIRLALEDAGVDYVDIGRRDGASAVANVLDNRHISRPPFAPPAVRAGAHSLISHVAHILQRLGPELGLAPDDADARSFCDGVQLTVTDFVAEIHDTHHPLGPELHTEEQFDEARRRAELFRAHRLPKYLDYFEQIAAVDDTTPWLIGAHASTADLSLFQVIAGLHYAFPHAMTYLSADIPRLAGLYEAVAARDRIAAYLISDRRQAFNNSGVFRYYPELDGPVGHGH